EQKKDAATAEREYRQYIDLSKGTAEAWLNLAFFLRRQLRIDEMEEAVVKLSQAPIARLDALVEGSEILYRTGRSYPFATELLRRYLAAGPVEAAPAFKAHYLLGTLLEKQGDKEGAAREYRASLALVRDYDMAQQALNRVVHCGWQDSSAQSGVPNDFPKLLRQWRPAHYNLCVAAKPRPDPWEKSD